MECPYCGSDKVTSLYGIPGLMDRCTSCGSYFQIKDDDGKSFFDLFYEELDKLDKEKKESK